MTKNTRIMVKARQFHVKQSAILPISKNKNIQGLFGDTVDKYEP